MQKIQFRAIADAKSRILFSGGPRSGGTLPQTGPDSPFRPFCLRQGWVKGPVPVTGPVSLPV